jgi:2-polyprenyl-3-methyl-5-hydroxy-6-metoxy-1,4-benzoquinol methylase
MDRFVHLSRMWNARVGTWQQHVTSDHTFADIRDEVRLRTAPSLHDTVVDLGCGAGFLSLPLASVVREVIAVDASQQMIGELIAQARKARLSNVRPIVADLAVFDLPRQSVDVVVSNYALHHLTDRQKTALLLRAHRWLRPGGRLVIADMMFGRGLDSRDRTILRQKVIALGKRGPAGWWRIVKNVVRLGLRIGSERPASPAFWLDAARLAGFADVSFHPVRSEAGLVVASVGEARVDQRKVGSPAFAERSS